MIRMFLFGMIWHSVLYEETYWKMSAKKNSRLVFFLKFQNSLILKTVLFTDTFSRTLWTIILPICKPILVTVAIIQVFGNWNEFSFALVLIKDVALQTVPLALTQFKGQFASDYPKQMAAMLITMSPIVILYFAFSKEIIKGMVAGAVKG